MNAYSAVTTIVSSPMWMLRIPTQRSEGSEQGGSQPSAQEGVGVCRSDGRGRFPGGKLAGACGARSDQRRRPTRGSCGRSPSTGPAATRSKRSVQTSACASGARHHASIILPRAICSDASVVQRLESRVTAPPHPHTHTPSVSRTTVAMYFLCLSLSWRGHATRNHTQCVRCREDRALRPKSK